MEKPTGKLKAAYETICIMGSKISNLTLDISSKDQNIRDMKHFIKHVRMFIEDIEPSCIAGERDLQMLKKIADDILKQDDTNPNKTKITD